MKRIAIIDIGSNSIKFLVGERCSDGTVATLIDQNDSARLGEGLWESGALSDAAMERNAAAVARFAALARETGAEETVCVGTMALRSAANSADFLRVVEETCGLAVRVIPGEEEARLSYLAVRSGLPVDDGEVLVFDTGGGSTEFIFGRGREVLRRFSLDLGAIRITERFFHADPVEQGRVEAALQTIAGELTAAGIAKQPCRVVGIGGTVTTMGAVAHKLERYDPAVIQGSLLRGEEVQRQIALYGSLTIPQRREIPGLPPKRADVILGGGCIVKSILDCLGARELTISDRGLRHGLAWELMNE